MRKKPLTERQRDILNYIYEYIRKEGFAPSIRDICKAFDISSSRGAHRHLETLELKGYIERKSTPRSIKVLDDSFAPKAKNVMGLPLVGEIAAGKPIFAAEHVEEVIPLSPEIMKKAEDGFMLRVKGDSMIGDGIHHGDMVIVKPQHDAINGEIVVAMVEDEATVKKFYKEKDHVRLEPSNEKYVALKVDKDFKVVGKVVGLLRKY